MSAEKKSLRRFLLIYITSTLLLVGIGEWFYYKANVHQIKESQMKSLKEKVNFLLLQNKGMLRSIILNKNSGRNIDNGIKIAVFKNKKLIFANFPVKNVSFNKEFRIEGNKIYYLRTMPKIWGTVYVLSVDKLNMKPVEDLRIKILIFNIFVLLFIGFISYILGKIFIKPMKEMIISLENFIRDATHEMNTPISVILTNIEMLKMKNIETKELDRIEFSAKRLEKIFKDLAFVILNHTQKKDIYKINMQELLKNRIRIFNTLLENKNIKLQKNCEDLYVTADKEDLIRLIDNILSNAIKYSPANETIVIFLKNGALRISNKGKIEHLEKITKKFYRENTNEGGFGLGLYIIKKICDYYGFKFEIKNENGYVKTAISFKNQ